MENSWKMDKGMYGSSWTQQRAASVADYTDISVLTSILSL